jgi:hypothetical protein
MSLRQGAWEDASPAKGVRESGDRPDVDGYVRGGRIGLCAMRRRQTRAIGDLAKGLRHNSLKLTSMPVEPLASTSPQSKESIRAEGEQYDGTQPVS